MKRVGVVALSFFAAACGVSPGGPSLVSVGVYATPSGGVEEQAICVTLPVLLGSHVTRGANVDGAFDIGVDATRETVNVSFRNGSTELASPLAIPASSVRAGYSEIVSVSAGTETYSVRVTSGCGTTGSGAGGSG